MITMFAWLSALSLRTYIAYPESPMIWWAWFFALSTSLGVFLHALEIWEARDYKIPFRHAVISTYIDVVSAASGSIFIYLWSIP